MGMTVTATAAITHSYFNRTAIILAVAITGPISSARHYARAGGFGRIAGKIAGGIQQPTGIGCSM
jgi:hypothetical protein